MKLGLPMLRKVLDADPNGWPGPVIPPVDEGPQDPHVHMLHIRRCSISVSRGNQDQLRINLLRLSIELLIGEGLLHSLGKLLELARVHILVKLLRSTIHG